MSKEIKCADYDKLSSKAADIITEKISNSKKQFSIAVPGGYSALGTLKCLARKKIGWPAVNAFMADERWLPLTDTESNYKRAYDVLFSHAKGINAFPFSIQKGLSDYNSKFLGITNGRLDLALLGAGEDGHIASIFPGSPAIKSAEEGYLLVENAPKPPSKRITLSPESIARASTVILLFSSAAKRKAFESFADPKTEISKCPAKIALKSQNCIILTALG